MKAMVLAAGLGTRMRPLTDHTPKPLIPVAGRTLLDFHLDKLSAAGICDVVINTHWLADKVHDYVGSGEQWGLRVTYSHEPELLETAGGILQALPHLSESDEAFLVINSDVYCELDLGRWIATAPALDDTRQAYLALVPNPAHHPEGDFLLADDGRLLANDSAGDAASRFTYAGIALFTPAFFEGLEPGPRPLGPVLRDKIAQGCVFGVCIPEYWQDVGTPERLAALEHYLAE